MANEKAWVASAVARREKAVQHFWNTVESLWPNEYDYSKFQYLGATTKTTVLCKKHGEFVTSPTYLVNGCGCPTCGLEKKRAFAETRKLGWGGFVSKAHIVHGDKYQYPEQTYIGNKSKVAISCPVHGVFQQKPNHHLRGQGCPECANDSKRERNAEVSALVKEGLFSRLVIVNEQWSYDLDSFQGMSKPLKCQCRLHGPFAAWPNNILNNSGCSGCGENKHKVATLARRVTLQEIESRGRAAYGDLFDYHTVEQGLHGAMVTGVCTKHKTKWRQASFDHGRYNPCPRCSHHLSKGEDAIFRFVSTFTSAEQRNRSILKPKELDIYLPEAKLAVEYCGEYWHSLGNAEEVRGKKNNHRQKYMDCRAQGIRLLTVYETEWLSRNYAIRRLLRNALGKGRGRLMARKCELQKVSSPDARSFYERYHPQGGDGTGNHYGLYWRGKLVACMRFTMGANDRGDDRERVWTLTRYATRITVAGAASRLFNAFIKEHNPREVKSFSDNRYFEGGMYESLGFALEHEGDADYQVWSPKLGLRPKSHYQRRLLQKRLDEHGIDEVFDAGTDTRTEAEMTYLMGARRIYDCGKKRWVWVAP